MSVDLFRERLESYSLATLEDEEYALKQMLQETILFALAENRFFKHGIFHGGTALRIHYRLPRFSEDLDFLLDEPDQHFSWEPYEQGIVNVCRQFGIEPEIQNRSQVSQTVQPPFVKDNSIGKLLSLSFHHDPRKKLTIKLEIDTNPPAGSAHEYKFLDFPVTCSVRVQNLPSSFALKNHAVLCRSYTKGRDWYDFNWYLKRKTPLNFELLKNALNQQGPWSGKIDPTFNLHSYFHLLREKIDNTDWRAVIKDVEPFLPSVEKRSLQLWGKPFFLGQVEKLEAYLVNE